MAILKNTKTEVKVKEVNLLSIETGQNAFFVLSDDLFTEGATRLLEDYQGVILFKPHLDKCWYLIAHKNFATVKDSIHAEYIEMLINCSAKWVIPEGIGRSISVEDLHTFRNPDWSSETFNLLLKRNKDSSA